MVKRQGGAKNPPLHSTRTVRDEESAKWRHQVRRPTRKGCPNRAGKFKRGLAVEKGTDHVFLCAWEESAPPVLLDERDQLGNGGGIDRVGGRDLAPRIS